jgi:16S rRNA G1207 methylase RsmC
MAKRSPNATVWAVDVNSRARELCLANAEANGITNLNVVGPEDVPADITFACVWSNPPIRIGKPALHEMLLTWLARLATDGAAAMVVHKHLGADSLQRWLTEQGYPTTRLASSSGYRILQTSKRVFAATPGGTETLV